MVPNVVVTFGNEVDDIQKSRGPSKQKFGRTQPNNTKKSNAMLIKKLMLTGAMCVLLCMLTMLVLGGSGYNVNAQDRFVKTALTVMMKT